MKYFSQVPINILANGRAHIRVELDGQEKAEPDGMWIVSSDANIKGKYILDYDPNISTTALVIFFSVCLSNATQYLYIEGMSLMDYLNNFDNQGFTSKPYSGLRQLSSHN